MQDPDLYLDSLTPTDATNIPEIPPDLENVLKTNRMGKVMIGDDDVDLETLQVVVNPASYKRGWRTWINDREGTTAEVPTVAIPFRDIPEGGVPKPPTRKTFDKGEEVDAEWKPFVEFKGVVVHHSKGDLGRVVTFSHDSGWANAFFAKLLGLNHERAELIRAGKVAKFPCPVLMFDTKEVKGKYGAYTKMTFTVVDWAKLPQEDADLLSQAKVVAAGATQAALPATTAEVVNITETDDAPAPAKKARTRKKKD